eukprot:sb/3477189/
MAKYHKIGLGGSVTVKKRWQTAVFQLRKSSVITKLELDNDDENLYDGVLLIQVICGSEMGEVGTKPDIYCTLEADSHGEMSKKTKTKIKKATINPVWEEVCVMFEQQIIP